MLNKENWEIYDNIANLYVHRSIKEINGRGDEIAYLVKDYTFPRYHLKTQFIPLFAYRNLKNNKEIRKIKLGKTIYLELNNGVKGKFCSINKFFRIGKDFMPGFCFYASKEIAEQLRANNINFDFIVINRSNNENKIYRHAIIRTNLPGFENPVIIDGSISAIIEENLFWTIQPYPILAIYHNSDIPKDIHICLSYDKKAGGQFIVLEDRIQQEKQFHNVKIDQREM